VIGLDSNIIVRYLTADDPVQSPAARNLIQAATETDPAHISLVALIETYWVLRQSYRYSAQSVNAVVSKFLDTAEITVAQSDAVRSALATATSTGRELPDILIALLGAQAGCDTTYTFDKKASVLPGMTLLKTATA
jgi:predicted nucleic-acid-binding protein